MTDNQLRDLLHGVAGDEQFAPGFSSRVLNRLDQSRLLRVDSVSAALARHAVRLIPAVLAASIALVAWSYTATTPATETTLATLTNAEAFE